MAQSKRSRPEKALTDNFGAPVGDNQNSLPAKVGKRTEEILALVGGLR